MTIPADCGFALSAGIVLTFAAKDAIMKLSKDIF